MTHYKHTHSLTISLFLLSFFSSFLLFFPTSFLSAATPYNAVASKLKDDTTTGVFNSTSDQLKENTVIEGIISGKNGSTFFIKLPTEDAGYNVLVGKETSITKNGKAATMKNIVKGLDVTVTGTLDTSTYTLKASKVEIGKKLSEQEIIKDEPSPTKDKPEMKPKTEQKLLLKSLKKGQKNADVVLLQEKLISLGLLPKEAATGYYGPQTVSAVKKFQKKHKLDQTGSVGPKTRSVLNEK